MSDKGLTAKIRLWANVYKRIRYFEKMYPLSVILKDLLFFPVDYFITGRKIRTIHNINIAITHACNIRCRICYFYKQLDKKTFLPLEVYKRIIDDSADSRPCIILSGGEPLIHPDLLNMVAYAKEKKLAVQIFTNGTILTSKIADRLVELGLDYINFTLLGNEQSHSLVAQAPKSYEMFIRNLEYFAGHRGSTLLILNYTISPQSIDDIGHSVELVNRYNLDGLRIQHYNYLLPQEFDAQDKVIEKMFGATLTNEARETEGLLEGVADKIVKFMNVLARTELKARVQWAPTLSPKEIKNWYAGSGFKTQRKCLYPWRGVTVDATGKIYPCYKIYLEIGDLAQESLFDAWNSKSMQGFRQSLKKGLFPACARCCKL